jgi:hypothetical protein
MSAIGKERAMMKRLFVATGIFGLGIFLLLLPTLWRIGSVMRDSQMSGIGVDVGYWTIEPKLTGVAALFLLAILSYWLSGKLVKAAR